MEDIIDQVMRTYGMMVNLTAIEEQSARERLAQFLKDKNDNTRKLTVEGVKYRVCAGNARIEIGRPPRENGSVAGPNPIKRRCWDQMLPGSWERVVPGNKD